MNSADIYIEKYKQLEKAVRERYGLKNGDSISRFLSSQDKFRRFADDIRYCQEVRNWLQHEPKVSDEFSLCPSEEMIKFIDDLTDRVRSPKRCIDVAIKADRIFCKNMQANLMNAVSTMKERGFSHVPIVRDGTVVGVLDENSLFNYLCDRGSADLKGMKISDVEKYLALEGRKTERFLFAKPLTYLEDIEDEIEKETRRGNRVVMVFLTTSGKADSRLKGMLTPWDVRADGRSN